MSPKRIFVVHGHDEVIRERVARFIQSVGLHPVLLSERPNRGRTMLDKLKTESATVRFAVALLTADDVGRARNDVRARPRARQNVIFELGYFTAMLGDGRTAVLFSPGVELPSNYHGVAWIQLDEAGGWKTAMLMEFRAAGISFRSDALFE